MLYEKVLFYLMLMDMVSPTCFNNAFEWIFILHELGKETGIVLGHKEISNIVR